MLRRSVQLTFVAAVASAAFTPHVASAQERPLDVWILDIGQGACIFVDCPNANANVLVDCGTNRASPRANTGSSTDEIAEWVNGKLGAKSFNSVVISHAHTDHYSAISGGKIDAARVSQVFLGGLRWHYQGTTPGLTAINQWLDDVPLAATNVHTYAAKTFIKADASFQCAPATVDVLTSTVAMTAPASSFQSRENTNSVVLRISHGGSSIVLPGDAEEITQNSAMENATAGGLTLGGPTIVVASHHGSRTHGSNGEPWRDFWKAPVAVFSGQIRHSHRHPKCSTVDGYAAHAALAAAPFRLWCGETSKNRHPLFSKRLVSTYDNGHILIRFTTDGMKVYCQGQTGACDGPIPPGLM